MAETRITGPFILDKVYTWDGDTYGPGETAVLPCGLASELARLGVIDPLTGAQQATCGLVEATTDTTIVLGTFQAIANGTGYSIGDIIILRQTPPAAAEYYNASTNAVITEPPGADLGPVGGTSSNVTANAGTNLNTSALALESGGNLAAIATSTAAAATQATLATRASTTDVQAVRDRLISGGPALGNGAVNGTTQRTTLASDSPGVTNLSAIGLTSSTAATSDTGTFSLVALFKRALRRLSNLHAVFATGAVAGGTADNAAVSGTIAAPGTGLAILIKQVTFSYDADPAAATNLTITSNAVNLIDVGITTGGPGPMPGGVRADANQTVTYTLPASGTAGNFGRLKIYYSIVEVL